MTLETKCGEYKEMFNKLEQEQADKYARIRLYANSCLGIEQPNYKSCPENDLWNLKIELSTLKIFHKEYTTVCDGLYTRMEHIVNSNKWNRIRKED